MIFKVQLNVVPRAGLLDPQGKTAENGLHSKGFTGFSDVRIGKNIAFTLEAANAEEAKKMVDEACRTLLYNPVMESYHFDLEEA